MSNSPLPFSSFVKTHDPLVSIVIPCFNKAAYIKETILSAVTQDYPHTEILVVDDGSTDGSQAVIEETLSSLKGKQIGFLQKQNGGISDCRNYAFEKVGGRILLALDGDDLATPTYVSKALSLMRQEGSNLVCANVEIFGAENSEWIPPPYDQYAIRYNNCIPTLVMFDRELWKSTGGYKKAFPFNEDWDFFIGATRFDLKVSRIQEKAFRYRVTTEGLANCYIKDSWTKSVSLMITSNSDLYPVEEVLWAHEQLGSMFDRWEARFKVQDKLHSSEWLLKFWLGLRALGKSEGNTAFEYFKAAVELTNGKEWQPIYRMAMMMQQNNPGEARGLFQRVRTLRPDMKKPLIPIIGE